MALSEVYDRTQSLRFSMGEVTGAIGDSVTVFPLVIAVATLTDLSLATLLLGFAVFQIVWGLYYGLPVSVEPMKALTALVIAGTLTVHEFLVAGLLAGVALLLIGQFGLLTAVQAYIGQPVIRGIQLAVALLLFKTSVTLSVSNIAMAGGATVLALIVIAAGYRQASALVVLGAGVAVTIFSTGLPSPHLPTVSGSVPPLVPAVSRTALEATVAQLAMTVGNAAVATSLLLDDYFDADVSPDELATSMGAMNLLAIPLGAMPMCHGSGGVAGKYAFGARTAGANIVLGVFYAGTAVVASGLVLHFPVAMLGIVLALISTELGRAGLQTEYLPLTLVVGILGVVAGVGVAFVVGAVTYVLVES